MTVTVDVKNVQEVEAEAISAGVTQRILLERTKSASGKLSVSILDIEPWSDYGPLDYQAEVVYYVLNGRGNLAYAPGGLGEITNVMCDWDNDSYSYIAPSQYHSVSNEGQIPLTMLKVQYDTRRSPDSVMPWGGFQYSRDISR